MPRVFIPPLLRPLTQNRREVTVEAATVRQAIDELERQFPGVAARLLTGNELKPELAIAVDGAVSPNGLATRLTAESELHFLPAVGGG